MSNVDLDLVAPTSRSPRSPSGSRHSACRSSSSTQSLHAAIGRDFVGEPPASLASRHASVGVEQRDDDQFRCVDCHGGTSWPGRIRVKLLAANDAFWYAAGRYSEPTSMASPLWDEDRPKCHPVFDTTRSARRDHASLPRAHGTGRTNRDRIARSRAGAYLRADHVKAQCATLSRGVSRRRALS